ncbi:MAG TPA: fluoride efflux transporter CrcB [Candidatus Acidoferrales bacterium]|nr:fluoride efflux transporter CrcB [Candidatus Acidoferrales bacterium]
MRVLLVAVFGLAGTLARYSLEGAVQSVAGAAFPLGTLVVNLSGCFLLGLVARFSLNHAWVPADWRVGVTVGFFGAFTTFSTFGWETVRLLDGGEWTKAGLYVAASLLGGLLLMLLGIRLGGAL